LSQDYDCLRINYNESSSERVECLLSLSLSHNHIDKETQGVNIFCSEISRSTFNNNTRSRIVWCSRSALQHKWFLDKFHEEENNTLLTDMIWHWLVWQTDDMKSYTYFRTMNEVQMYRERARHNLSFLSTDSRWIN
jgi:hypothetical protein